MRTAHGDKYHFLFFQRPRPRRAHLPERYHHRHCRLVTRPPGRISCRWCGRVPRGFLFLSPPHVRLPCHPRYPLRRHVPDRGQVWKRQLPCRSWRDRPWRPHRHRGIHLGQGLRIQHLGIRHAETPFRNTSGLHRIRHRTLTLEKQKMGQNDPPLPWVLTPYSP